MCTGTMLICAILQKILEHQQILMSTKVWNQSCVHNEERLYKGSPVAYQHQELTGY